jgi:hypothetical protein
MARYGVTISSFATATTERTAALLHANATGEAGELQEYLLGGDGLAAPANTQHQAMIKTYDAATAGTPGSTPTPTPLNQYANAARILAAIEFTAEPTVLGGSPLLFTFNQMGGWGWARTEGYDMHFAYRTTGLVGWACTVQSSAVGSVGGTVIWAEP